MKKLILALFLLFSSSVCFAGDLGGGYKGAKWGMSPDEVENALKDSLDYPYTVYHNYQGTWAPAFLVAGNAEPRSRLEFLFYNDELLFVEYWPQNDGNGNEEEVLSAMKLKYGKHNKIQSGYVTGIPTKEYIWNDGKTTIKLRAKRHQWNTNIQVYYSSDKLMRAYKNKEKSKKEKETERNVKDLMKGL